MVAAFIAGAALLAALLAPTLLGANVVFRSLLPVIRTVLGLAVLGFGTIAFFKWLSARSKVGPKRDEWSGRQSPSQRRREIEPRLVVLRESFERATERPPVQPAQSPKPTSWSLPLLRSLDWKRFEYVAAAYFQAKKFRCVTQAYGPDGGIDVTLYFGDMPKPVGLVQCKAWRAKLVGVKEVRELLGVMANAKVDRGYFVATGEFSDDAIQFAATNPIKLISGADLLAAIAQMDEASRARLLELSTEGDYTTPSCPSCGDKLFKKKLGARTVWACHRFPRCRTRIATRAE